MQIGSGETADSGVQDAHLCSIGVSVYVSQLLGEQCEREDFDSERLFDGRLRAAIFF